MKIDNFISSLKNAQNSNLEKFSVKKSKIIYKIINIMIKNGYLSGFSEDRNHYTISLKYPVLNKIDVEMVSKPSRRVYMNYRSVKESSDLLILSTEKGIVTNKDFNKVGGEVLIRIVN